MNVGFVGLGKMGSAMAANLLKANHRVVVWNRSPDRAHALVQAGATVAADPKAAAAGQDAVISMLADDEAVEAVTHGNNGIAAGLRPGGSHISMSTIAVATAKRLDETHRSRAQRFIAAPVFGRPEAAIAAKLFIVAAGDPEAVAGAQTLFSALGQRVFEVGTTPSAANLVKLCGNFMILSAIEALGEAMTLASKGGIPKARFLEVLTGTLFDAPIFRTYGTILAEERFHPAGFAAPLGLKDMRLAGQAAETLLVPMPLLSLLRDHLLQTIAVEGAEIDWSGIARTIGKNGGT